MILLFYLLFIPALCLAQSKTKPVTTLLNAKWNETPLLLEAAEYMADENSATFWSFIETVNSQNLIEYAKKTDKEKFNLLLDVASGFLSSSQIKLLKFSLSLRVYSPKIEAFHQMAIDSGISSHEGCKVAVEFCQEIICNVDNIAKQLEKKVTSCSNIYTIDHQYPGGEANKEFNIFKVVPICLPPEGNSFANYESIVAGFGDTNARMVVRLRKVVVEVLHDETCIEKLGGKINFYANTMMCAAMPGHDACNGDSGGPLMSELKRKTFYQIGIVSNGIGCGNYDDPGVYTRVNKFIDWILHITNDGIFCDN